MSLVSVAGQCGLHSSRVFPPWHKTSAGIFAPQRICIARVAFSEWSKRKRGGDLVVLVPCISDVTSMFELRGFARSSTLVACIWEMPWSVVVLTDRFYCFPHFLKPNSDIGCEIRGWYIGIGCEIRGWYIGIGCEIRGWYIGIWNDLSCFVMWLSVSLKSCSVIGWPMNGKASTIYRNVESNWSNDTASHFGRLDSSCVMKNKNLWLPTLHTKWLPIHRSTFMPQFDAVVLQILRASLNKLHFGRVC